MPVVMIVDDEPLACQALTDMVEKLGYQTIAFGNGQAAIHFLLGNKIPAPDIVLLDLFMPETDGLTVIRALHGTHPSLPIIAVSMHGTSRQSLQAINLGAYDFLTRPFTAERLEVALANALKTRHILHELERLRPAPSLRLAPEHHLGLSDIWQRVVLRAAEAAERDGTLILEGEEGTGKTTLARAIHASSTRKDKPFLVIDTAQDIASLHALISGGQGGTLLINHTGRAPEAFLAGLEKLYHAMSEQHIRLIFCITTSPDMSMHHAIERFFHKERAQALRMPALRERREDIPTIATEFVDKASRLLGKYPPQLTAATLESLQRYDWPGNIRQLHAELFSLLLHCKTDILPIPACCRSETPGVVSDTAHHAVVSLLDKEGHLRSLEEIEGEVIQFALTHYRASRSDIARKLGIGRTTLYRKSHQFCS